ncbi:ATP-binding protein, partial [Candidatus Margulisiibacteriota bacterium]
YLYFNHQKGSWEWDIRKIQEVKVSTNVVEFMLERLGQLPQKSIQILKLAASIGDEFELNILAEIIKNPVEAVIELLSISLRQGMIYQKSDKKYKFAHDRVQQAAYSLIEEGEKEQIHLQIGRIMINNLSIKERDEKIIEIVGHFNKGQKLIKEKQKRIELTKLNLEAGKKAKATAAYQSAYEYLNIGEKLLDEIIWREQYSLAFDLCKEFVECTYLCGKFDEAGRYVRILLQKTKSNLEKAEILYLQIIQYSIIGRLEEAVQTGLKVLLLLGVKIPYKPSFFRVIANALKIKLKIKFNAQGIKDQKAIEDKEVLLCMKTIIDLFPPVYMTGNETLFVYLGLKLVLFALKYGDSPESAYAYLNYGVLLTSGFNDMKTGYFFGKMGFDSYQKTKDIRFQSRTYFFYAAFIHAWNKHFRELEYYYKKSIESGLESGNFFDVAHSCKHYNIWDPNKNLSILIKEYSSYFKLIQDINCQDALDISRIIFQFFVHLSDDGFGKTILEQTNFNKLECIERMAKEKNYIGTTLHHHYGLLQNYIFENQNIAYEHSKKLEILRKAVMGMPWTFEICLFIFLINTQVFDKSSFYSKYKIYRKIKKEYKTMKTWAAHCPVNFLHHKLLMEAEIARIKGKNTKAQKLYDKAITAAKENEYLRYEALCNELAAKFHLAQGNNKFASVYMEDAYYCYERWGAAAKVKHLQETYPQLLKRIRNKDKETEMPLDFKTILEATQTISGEIQTKNLIKELMTAINKVAGAQESLIVLKEDLESNNNSIINYVARTKELVVLADASSNPNYASDQYIQKNNIKSVFCLPILQKNELKAVIYLENNAATNAFTKERIDAIKILAAQAAISLENALLYENLEEKVVKRTKDLKNINSTMSHELKNTCYGIRQIVNIVKNTEPGLKGKSTKMLNSLVEQSSKLFDFSRNYLYMEMANAGIVKIEKTKLDLGKIIKDAIEANDYLSQSKKINVINEITQKVELIGDKNALHILFNNLINNAVKYSYENGEIRISLTKENKIIIEDFGEGIDPKIKEKLFQDFEKGKKDDYYLSTGLGLGICKRIVDLHGWGIEIRSVVDKGTRVLIDF